MRLQRRHGLFHVPRVFGRHSEPCMDRVAGHSQPLQPFFGSAHFWQRGRGIMLPIEPRLKPLGATIIHFAADSKASRHLPHV